MLLYVCFLLWLVFFFFFFVSVVFFFFFSFLSSASTQQRLPHLSALDRQCLLEFGDQIHRLYLGWLARYRIEVDLFHGTLNECNLQARGVGRGCGFNEHI
jgi:hypothetical protein